MVSCGGVVSNEPPGMALICFIYSSPGVIYLWGCDNTAGKSLVNLAHPRGKEEEGVIRYLEWG